MNKIIVPISFSDTSKNALYHAHMIALQYGANLSLLHCYPTQEYNREYDFGKDTYDKGIRRMLVKFYNECIENDGKHKFNLITYAGALSEVVAKISPEYDLFVLSRKTGFKSKFNSWFSDKFFYISSKALCPVLITSTKQHEFTLKNARNIWHIQRNEGESGLVNSKLNELGFDTNLVKTKSLQQKTFVSAFWRNIVSYSKSHDESLLKDIGNSFEMEQVDLLILVNHLKGMFEKFIKDDTFQIISQFDIPILILQSKNK